MPGKYESPDVKSTLTPEEIRLRYRDAALVIFKEQQLQQRPKIVEESVTYLSFGINRRVMTYTNNGNEPVIVRRTLTDASTQANENSRFSSQIFRRYRKPRDNCSIS